MPEVELIRRGQEEREAARRRLALQIAVQLPQEAQEARLVLALVGSLLERFLTVPTVF